jgi:2-polyprenyl-3-methyl-5-hydroxy-6-metoxy-1,4-benzoquinol methylase
VADARLLPFQHGSFDFVLCSSFLHHFPDSEVIDMIAELRHFARRALLILDLERHPVAHSFLPTTRWALRWSPLAVHDGTISVASAFKLEELVALAHAAGSQVLVARRHRPWFRVSAVIAARTSLQHIIAESPLGGPPVHLKTGERAA